MINHRYLLIISVLLFLVSAGMLYFGYSRFREQVSELEHSLEQLSEPDEWRKKIDDIRTGYDRMQSTVRSYNLSGDHVFLEQFYAEKDTLVDLTDDLRPDSSANENSGYMDSLLHLFESKTMVYDSLLQIQYYKEVRSTLNEVSEINIPVTTYEVPEDKGNILQRLFSSRYTRKAIQEKNDSIIDRRNREIIAYNRSIKALREKERNDLDSLAKKELELVAADMTIDTKIRSVISMAAAEQNSISAANRMSVAESAIERLRKLRLVLIGGAVILFLMMLILLLQIRKAIISAKAVRKAKEQAEVLARGRQEFLATMSHEIRTPLTVISGMVRNLRPGDVPDPELVRGLGNSVDHLHYVVNDVLDDARLERGDLVLQEVDFNAADLMNELSSQFSLQCSKKGIEFRLQNDLKPDSWLMGDPVRLKQVIYNIVGNAIKFTVTGHVALHASVIESEKGPEMHLVIKDTGNGIPADKLESIFQRFDGSSEDSRKHTGGTGIGLSISKQIIEQQGGSIIVTSEEGVGTRFEIVIPYSEGTAIVPKTPFKTVSPGSDVLAGVSLVYLEDDPFIAELVTADLRQAGADVTHHLSFESYRSHPQSASPDAFIIDLQLGEDSGLDVLNDIRSGIAEEDHSGPLFIAVTANPYLRESALDAGFDHALIKPVKPHELISLLKRIPKRDQTEKRAADEPLFDLSELHKTSGGNEDFVKRMINVFMTTSFAGANNLLTYASNGDLAKAGATAHRLAPSFEQMGVAGLAVKLRKIEELSADPSNVSQVIDLATEVKKELRSVIDELKKVSKKMSYEQ